jgi:tetratricopeptide (TPR) repeat protein
LKYSTGDKKSGLVLLNQAVELARRLGNQQAIWLTTALLLFQQRQPQHMEQCLRVAEALWAGSHVGLNINSVYALVWTGDISLATGRRKFAEEVFGELRTMAERTGNFLCEIPSVAADANLTLMDGRLEDALDMATSINARGKEAGVPVLASAMTSLRFRAWFYLGASMKNIEQGIAWHRLPPIQCIFLAYLGRKNEAAEILEKDIVQKSSISTYESNYLSYTDTIFLEAALLIGHKPAAEIILKRLNVPGLCTTGLFWSTCIPRHLGGAAALLERYDEARKHYQEAIRVCAEMPFRPELALTRLQLAELLLEHYPAEKKEALEHLDFAIKEFREMKMQPSLERALRHKEILKA